MVFSQQQETSSDGSPSAPYIDKEEFEKIQERYDKIDQIRQSYFKKQISFDDAERKLMPIAKEELKFRLAAIDNEIRHLKQGLKELEKAKQNPDYLLKKRIKEILTELPIEEMPVTQKKEGS